MPVYEKIIVNVFRFLNEPHVLFKSSAWRWLHRNEPKHV